MSKNRSPWNRVEDYKNAEGVHWLRLLENSELTDEVRRIQSKFGLPLILQGNMPLFENPTYTQWMGWDEKEETKKDELNMRSERLFQSVRGLLHKYQIPSQYLGSLWNLIITGEASPSYRSGGFPTFTQRINEYGEWKPECCITPETDLKNLLVLETITDWQMKNKTEPPRPIRTGRRTDWRPVWEWHRRNPNVSVLKIAKALGVNRVTVSRAMERLDKEHATKPG